MVHVLELISEKRKKIMVNTNDVLRQHLSNIIYIDNNFGLDLFKTFSKPEEQVETDYEEAVLYRRTPSETVENEDSTDLIEETKAITVEDFFRETQTNALDLNIMPYYYVADKFWDEKEKFKCKLSHFPLIIIDWQLEKGENAKNGVDVFEEIIKDNDILHYYVIYSNEIGEAIKSFIEKYPKVQIGQISENEVAFINNAIIMFANKRTSDIGFIIDKLTSFTVDNYGYLPQLFLSVKQQIEDRTAVLYNDFMGLDSMMLPQLVCDEAYNYDGMQEEVILSLIVNKLREDLKLEKQQDCYGKNALIKMLKKSFSEEDFKRAKSVVKRSPDISFEIFCTRIKTINESNCIQNFDFDSLKNAAQIFLTGSTEEDFCPDTPEDTKNNKRKVNIKKFILFLSICSDKEYYSKYVKLLSLIKFSEYKTDLCWLLEECSDDIKAKGLCQGDVFIDENSDLFLLCITPSCQLIRPEKIKNTYTFLQGHFAKDEMQKTQKQSFSMHLINKEKDKVVLVNWDFYAPVVIDFSNKELLGKFKSYKRYFRMNMEYIHKVVELYSEYVKQIGVEELFGKCIDEKKFFVELKGDDHVGS